MFHIYNKNVSAKYYLENKDRLQKKLVKNIKIFLKNKKQQYGCEHCKNVSEDEKNKLAEYWENTIEWEKMPYYNYKKIF